MIYFSFNMSKWKSTTFFGNFFFPVLVLLDRISLKCSIKQKDGKWDTENIRAYENENENDG